MPVPGRCAIVAEVLIEAAAVPGMGFYLCARSGGNPYVCGTSLAVNAFLQSPSARGLAQFAAEKGCEIAVQGTDAISRIVVVEGARTANDIDRAFDHGKRTYSAMNTHHGVSQLMNYLSTR